MDQFSYSGLRDRASLGLIHGLLTTQRNLWLVLSLALFTVQVSAADYPAKVVRVIDGDTVEVAVEVWPDVTVKTALRVSGINTPESRGPGLAACEVKAGLAAKAFTQKFVGAGAAVVSIKGKDKYGGRMQGSLRIDGKDLAAALVEAKLAVPYDGGLRKGWC